MRNLSTLPVRSHRPGTAIAAYNHALAILRRPGEAEIVAKFSLRRAGHSRTNVLAHARYHALTRLADFVPVEGSTEVATVPRAFAAQLAGTRPGLERAVIDLESRYGLDHVSYARTLGVSNERARELNAEISERWRNELDPAMLAWLGPGSCEHLANVLIAAQLWPRKDSPPMVRPTASTASATSAFNNGSSTGTEGGPEVAPAEQELPIHQVNVGQFLEHVPQLAEHIHACEVCTARLSLMTTTKALVGQARLEEAPKSLFVAARNAARRLPGAPPPSIEPTRFDPGRVRALIKVGVVALGVVALIAGVIGFGKSMQSGTTQEERVSKLVRDTAVSPMLATPSIMTPSTKTALLSNNSARDITWTAKSDQPWININPSSGRIPPNRSVSIAVTTNSNQSGQTDATIAFTGDDGSRQTIRYDTSGG